MIINKDNKPPVGGMGGSIHNWERGLSPWHKSMFPEHLKRQAPEQEKLVEGWFALDWCGNQIAFIADGIEISFKFI